jgi:hypothetical protein
VLLPAPGGWREPRRGCICTRRRLIRPERWRTVRHHLPYAQEWLTAAECDDLLAFLKASLTQIAEIVPGMRSASPLR